jgi:mono/diheme cytochrome c family protein
MKYGLVAAVGIPALFWATAGWAASQAVYPSSVAKLFNAQGGNGALGTVTPGTPLVLSGNATGGAREAVTIDGWAAKGGETIIYQAPGQRVILAQLDAGTVSALKTLGAQTDSYGNTWEHVELTAWIASSDVVPDVATVWAAGQALYDSSCSSCHALHDPGEFTANQWPGEMKTMAPNAGFNAAQIALVTRYLQAHARTQ